MHLLELTVVLSNIPRKLFKDSFKYCTYRHEGGVNHDITSVAPTRCPLLDSFVTKEIVPMLIH